MPGRTRVLGLQSPSIAGELGPGAQHAVPGAQHAVPERASGGSSLRLPGSRLGIGWWAVMRARLWMLGVAVCALVLIIVWSAFSWTVLSPSGRTMVDTATGLVGALACVVFVERTRSTRHVRDLLIAVAFAVLGTADLIEAAASTLDGNPSSAWRWLILAARIAAGGILICAALCPTLRLGRFSLMRLGVLAESGADGEGSHGDGQQRFIVAGLIVLIIAWSNYLIVPFPGNGQLYAGDILKLAAYVLILWGCLLELRAVQSRLAERVAVAERRRMARDMHDGLAQELAFIASYSQRLDQNRADPATVGHLQAAAERALHDSRTTIAVLTSPPDAPLALLITRTVESFRSRFGVKVNLDLEPSLVLDAERRNAVLRILHEALTNAIRHGSATRIDVGLTADHGRPCLTIADDGTGFDVAGAVAAGKGLGLTSMHERAALLGGHLNVVSAPGSGTDVEVGLS